MTVATALPMLPTEARFMMCHRVFCGKKADIKSYIALDAI